ncbi:MAG: hypothetical protein A2Z17_00720 [Gammaproteobacteria bacterium RBG_16_66_13]|nr:MAG: hypothetical protein A2Z17_00720 [Gammaproteobacteria bacterium RBG_16_66_13]
MASNALPASYLPVQVALTLSEPVLLLVAIGIVVAFRRWQQGRIETDSFVVLIAWFVVPFAYVLIRRPPMYDGYRHFLFILPPLFVTAGLAIEAIGDHLRSPWLRGSILLLLAAPGAAGVLADHPYPYAHYNVFAGGMVGAYRRYETDFWLTCYKETLGIVNSRPDRPQRIYVLRNAPLARYYALPDIEVLPYEPELGETRVGSWLLATTRSNADASALPGDPMLLEVGRNGAVFCVVKNVVSVPEPFNSPAP